MKQGFVLIEVLLAAAIATVIGAALFTSLYQINRFTTIVDYYADVWTKASIVHRQIEKDLLGVFIPIAAEKPSDKKEGKEPGSSDKKNQEKKELDQSAKKEPIKIVTHVFYGVNKESVLDTLTFITDNPMQVYWGAKAGKAKPRIARVVYRLIKDKESKASYTLTRQEGYDLYFDAYKESDGKDMRQYPLIDGIKQMTVSYGIEDKDAEEDNAQEKKVKKITYKIIKEWKKEDNQKKQEDKENKKKDIQLPAFVLIKLNLWDQQKKRDAYFEFKIPLIAQGKPAPAYAPHVQPPMPIPVKPSVSPAAPHQETGSPLQDQIRRGIDAVGSSITTHAIEGIGINMPGLPMISGFATNLDTGRVEPVIDNRYLEQKISGSMYAQ